MRYVMCAMLLLTGCLDGNPMPPAMDAGVDAALARFQTVAVDVLDVPAEVMIYEMTWSEAGALLQGEFPLDIDQQQPILTSGNTARRIANAASVRDGHDPCYANGMMRVACDGWRLPTDEEFARLVSSHRLEPQDDEECPLRPLRLGLCYECTCFAPDPVPASIQNDIGLYDTLGNASEWVHGERDRLFRMGGDAWSTIEELQEFDTYLLPGGLGGVRLLRETD